MGRARGIERDWHALANEHRRRSLHRMINPVDPDFNIGDVHRDVLGELFDENGLGGSAEERQAIAERWHSLASIRAGCRQGSEVRRDSDATSAAEPVFS